MANKSKKRPMTLRMLSKGVAAVPTATAWQLADLGEARGKQQLFVRQSPQRLKALREDALIESAVSSNRIEGVEVARARIGTVVFGRPPFRDGNGRASRLLLLLQLYPLGFEVGRYISIERLGRGQAAQWRKTELGNTAPNGQRNG